MPIFASANNVKAFMDEELRAALSEPVLYRPLNQGGVAYGTERPPVRILSQLRVEWEL